MAADYSESFIASFPITSTFCFWLVSSLWLAAWF
jgi:hypothetical protein